MSHWGDLSASRGPEEVIGDLMGLRGDLRGSRWRAWSGDLRGTIGISGGWEEWEELASMEEWPEGVKEASERVGSRGRTWGNLRDNVLWISALIMQLWIKGANLMMEINCELILWPLWPWSYFLRDQKMIFPPLSNVFVYQFIKGYILFLLQESFLESGCQKNDISRWTIARPRLS